MLYASSALALMACAAPAAAQTAPAKPAAGSSAAGADDTVSEVVVTGQRASLQAAADIKRNSENVVDSIVASDIGKFPDRTVAAALQRVPGVQVSVGDNNEIVNPIIRGLGDILTTLDGREIFTGVGRGFAYQDLPAEALAGADVYKTSSAELIEGGVVGLVNLRLHKPFDFGGRTVAVNARGLWTENTDKASYTAGLLLSDRWDTSIGEMGGLIDVSYSDNHFNRPIAFNCDIRSGNVATGAAGVAAPTCLGGLNQEGEYERPQVNAAFQWRPTANLEVYANGLYAGYRSKWASIFLIDDVFGGAFSNVTAGDQCRDFLVGPAGFFNPNGAQQHLCNAVSFTSTNHGGFTSTQAHDDKTDLFVVATGARYETGPWSLAGDVSYQHSLIRNQNFILDIFKSGGGLTTTVENTNRDGGVVYQSPGLSDPANFALSPLNQDNIRDTGSEFAAKFDGKYEVGGWLKHVAFGLRFADHRAHHQQFLGGTCGTACGTLVSSVAFLPDNFLVHSSGIPSMNNGVGVIAPNQDLLRDRSIQDQLRALYGLQPGFPDFTADRSFEAEEKTYSGYIQGAYQLEIAGLPVDGLVGARVAHTQRDIAGAAFVTPSPTPTNPNPTPVLTPSSASTSDTDVMPNASARIDFGGGLQARLSYARAIARPSFGSLNPGLNYLISTNILILPAGSGGNPNLKPQTSDSFDATLEYYFNSTGYVSIAAYYKDITDRVISQSQVETINGFDYNITRPRNVGKVTLQGVEISGQYFFDFLPGLFGGLGAMANFTLADSQIKKDVDARLIGKEVQGVSRYNYNLGLLYEKYGVTARAVYTWRSKYYDELYGGTTLRPAGESLVLNQVRPNGRLDVSLGYEVRPGITVSVDGTNLTKANYKSYYGLPEYPRDRRFDDTTYSVGVSAKF
jgi:TonB-dependent receptor